MMPLKETQLAPAIQEKVDARRSAINDLVEVLATEQAVCPHRFVAEKPYESPNFNATRICLHCRLVEVGSHWSGGKTWSEKDFGPSVLGNVEGRIIQPITSDDLYALRVTP